MLALHSREPPRCALDTKEKGKAATVRSHTEHLERRNTLSKNLVELRQAQEIYMPSLGPLPDSDEDLDEAIKLWLPSDTGGEGSFTQWVHCEFIVSFEAIRPVVTPQVCGECHRADSTRQFYSIYRPTRQHLLSNPLSTSSRLSQQSRNTRRPHSFLEHTTNAYD